MDWTGLVIGVMVAQWVLIAVLVWYLIKEKDNKDQE